ncbi:hypothetical protein ACFL5V_00815 [Fibrobacterota bacterium]
MRNLFTYRILKDLRVPEAVYLWVISAVLGGAVLQGCLNSLDPQAGKTSETTNGVSVSVVDTAGAPLPGAVLTRIAVRDWAERIRSNLPVSSDTLEANSEGRIFIDSSLLEEGNFEVTAGTLGAHRELLTLAPGDTSVTLTLRPLKPYSLVLSSDSMNIERVRFAGSSYAGTRDSSGLNVYTIPRAAAGQYALVGQFQSGTASTLSPLKSVAFSGSQSALDSIRFNAHEILLEDFGDNNNRPVISSIWEDSRWMLNTDTSEGGNSQILSPVSQSPEDFSNAVSATEAYRERSLRVDYSLDDNHQYPFVETIMSLGGTVYDMTSVTSLEFAARGDGILEVVFSVRPGSGGTWANYQVSLTDTWQTFQVPTDSLLTPQGLPVDWQDQGRYVTSLSFSALSGSFFALDDIRLSGAGIQGISSQ